MLVDVILPVYNGERWVGEAIESLLAQTYPHWRLTVVDDASTDHSAERVRADQSRYPDKISLISLRQNLRSAGARMLAIRQTTGDAIAFLDQDDRWLPSKLERQVEKLGVQPQFEAVHTNVEIIDANGDRMPGKAQRENRLRDSSPYERFTREQLMRHLILDFPIRLVSSLVTRRSFLASGGFETARYGGEDEEFWVRYASDYRIVHIPEALVQRRLHAENASRVFKSAREDGFLAALRQIETCYPEFRSDVMRRRRHLFLRNSRIALQNFQLGFAAHYTWRLVQTLWSA